MALTTMLLLLTAMVMTPLVAVGSADAQRVRIKSRT